jgi:hypothetical protein
LIQAGRNSLERILGAASVFQEFGRHSLFKMEQHTEKEPNLRYEWSYGDSDELYQQGVQDDPYKLSANDRVEMREWLFEERKRELHTAAVLMLHPDNQSVAVLRLTTLSGSNWRGPIGATVWDSGWIPPGSSKTGFGAIDENLGFADLVTTLTNP